MKKKVYFVGAGPGDEGLITVKGLNCIRIADVIIHDNLINDKLLSYASETAEKIYVGKKADRHTFPQEEINKIITEKANENKTVVRLKGGDPFVFGRGGEEALACKNEDIFFEIIPGISSSVAALAYAGIPITHRGISSSFHVITGHEDPTKQQEDINYEVLAKLKGTLVFLMGLNNLSKICNELLKYGKSSDTPAAVISRGTSPEQKVVTGILATIEQLAGGLISPAIIVVGDVVNLREKLNWFEEKPLFGRKILVTRSREQASVLSQKLEELGAKAVEFPIIKIVPNIDEKQINILYESVDKYDWIIFTSVNGVNIFFDKFKTSKKDIRSIGNAKICAIGEATKQALENLYLTVNFTPEEYVAEALTEGLKDKIKSGDKVLIQRAESARELLPETLKEFGAVVAVFPLYNTIIPETNDTNLNEILKDIDTITFASSSTVTNFVQILGKENLNLLENKEIICIGPITAETARNIGIKSLKTAKEYTIDGMIKILTEK